MSEERAPSGRRQRKQISYANMLNPRIDTRVDEGDGEPAVKKMRTATGAVDTQPGPRASDSDDKRHKSRGANGSASASPSSSTKRDSLIVSLRLNGGGATNTNTRRNNGKASDSADFHTPKRRGSSSASAKETPPSVSSGRGKRAKKSNPLYSDFEVSGTPGRGAPTTTTSTAGTPKSKGRNSRSTSTTSTYVQTDLPVNLRTSVGWRPKLPTPNLPAYVVCKGPDRSLRRMDPKKRISEKHLRTTAGSVTVLTQATDRMTPIMRACHRIIKTLIADRRSLPFIEPVNSVVLQIPQYFDIITRPMDLVTVKCRLERNDYETPLDFAEDVRLVFSNCATFNPPDSEIAALGVELSEEFEKLYASLITPVDVEINKKYGHIADVCKVLEALSRQKDALEREVRSLKRKVSEPSRVSSQSADVSGLSREQRRRLIANIQKLRPEHVGMLVGVVGELVPDLKPATAGGEFELNIEQLDATVLKCLDRFVAVATDMNDVV